MPRPRRFKAVRITSFYIPDTFNETWLKVEEMAQRERKPINTLILEALATLVQDKYPGNPQTPLTSFQENGLKPIRLEALFLTVEVENIVKALKNPKTSPQHRAHLSREVAPMKVVRLARLNTRLREEKLQDLIDEAEALLTAGEPK